MAAIIPPGSHLHLFHDAEADIRLLEALEYDVTEAKNAIEIIDTSDMYQHGRRLINMPGRE
jgi:hypothetical protein